MNSLSLVKQFSKDCQNWLDYSLHAYADEYVYRCGIEALYHQHHLLIQQSFDDKSVTQIVKQMDRTIANFFVNEEITNQFINQSNQSTRRKITELKAGTIH